MGAPRKDRDGDLMSCNSCDGEFQIVSLPESGKVKTCPYCGNDSLTRIFRGVE